MGPYYIAIDNFFYIGGQPVTGFRRFVQELLGVKFRLGQGIDNFDDEISEITDDEMSGITDEDMSDEEETSPSLHLPPTQREMILQVGAERLVGLAIRTADAKRANHPEEGHLDNTLETMKELFRIGGPRRKELRAEAEDWEVALPMDDLIIVKAQIVHLLGQIEIRKKRNLSTINSSVYFIF